MTDLVFGLCNPLHVEIDPPPPHPQPSWETVKSFPVWRWETVKPNTQLSLNTSRADPSMQSAYCSQCVPTKGKERNLPSLLSPRGPGNVSCVTLWRELCRTPLPSPTVLASCEIADSHPNHTIWQIVRFGVFATDIPVANYWRKLPANPAQILDPGQLSLPLQ